jgi:NAD(P)-dependent dehydrogenase (short-subunit alcohol dehydrogenase family)
VNDLGKVSVVTGATQGLGFALVEGLAKQLTRADIVYLTGRDGDRVARAVERVSDAQARLRGCAAASSTSATAPR